MTSSPVSSSFFQDTRKRLDRLEKFLLSDPNNTVLLTDAFETALRCHEFERAQFHLRHGQAIEKESWAWRLKEGDFWLAQKRYEEARSVLLALQANPLIPPDLGSVLLHNLAFIDFECNEFATCVSRLSPLLDGLKDNPTCTSGVIGQALQVLWLRALHRARELKRAMDWTRLAEESGLLLAQAAGVASLIALDAEDIQSARRWSGRALTEQTASSQPLEALTTQASLALGESDAAKALQFTDIALKLNPEDGRVWSVVAFAELLRGDLKISVEHFKRSLAAMPEHIGTWHGLGWAQLLQRQLDEAQATFEKALVMDRNFAESHGGLAVILAMKQERGAAQQHIDLALRLDGSSLSPRYAQAILDGETQDTERFQRLVQRLLGGRATGFGDTLLDRVSEVHKDR